MRTSWVVILVACGTPTAAPKPAIVAAVPAPPPAPPISVDASIDASPPVADQVDYDQQKAAAMIARANNLARFPAPDVKPFGTAGDKRRGAELLTIARKTKTIDSYRAAVDADPSNSLAYYELASAYARAGTTDLAIPLLGQLAVAKHCELCDGVVSGSRYDDAWRSQWGTEGFRDVLAAWSTVPDDPAPPSTEPPPDPYVEALKPHVTCPPGTTHREKGDLTPGSTGSEWCEKGGLKHGSYYEHIDGCSMGEGGCSIYGEFRDGKRDGIWTTSGRYEDTVTGAYRRDAKHGLWLDEGKSKMAYRIYVDDKLEDLSIEYSADGKPTEELHYHAGVLEGRYVSYAMIAPFKPTIEGTMAAGKRDGHWQLFRDDGSQFADQHWKHGIPEGDFTYYDAKGATIATSTIAHGTGPWIDYSEDGLIAKGAYLDGAKDGAWTEGEESGMYKAGKRDGVWTFRRADGTQLAIGSYKAGKRSGTWTIFNDAGTDAAQVLGFRNDKLVTVDGEPASRALLVGYKLNDFESAPHVIEPAPDGVTGATPPRP